MLVKWHDIVTRQKGRRAIEAAVTSRLCKNGRYIRIQFRPHMAVMDKLNWSKGDTLDIELGDKTVFIKPGNKVTITGKEDRPEIYLSCPVDQKPVVIDKVGFDPFVLKDWDEYEIVENGLVLKYD